MMYSGSEQIQRSFLLLLCAALSKIPKNSISTLHPLQLTKYRIVLSLSDYPVFFYSSTVKDGIIACISGLWYHTANEGKRYEALAALVDLATRSRLYLSDLPEFHDGCGSVFRHVTEGDGFFPAPSFPFRGSLTVEKRSDIHNMR